MFKYLNRPIHPNHFSKSFDFNEEVRASYKFSPIDGGIVAVLGSKIDPVLEREDVKKIRFGYVPLPKKVAIESENDLLYLLAINFVDMEED
jgi:hypothetical protein